MDAPRLIAHRGASSVRPENTMAAFRHAIELGADGIEFDVHATSDGALVVIHDELLHRTSSGSGSPSQHDLRYIRSLDAGSWFDPRFAGERIPLLEEVLSLPAVEFELELKVTSKAAATRVVETVLHFDALRRTEFTSWNFPMLIWMKEQWRDVRLGLFSFPRWDWMTDDVYERAVLAPTPYGEFAVVHAYAKDMTPALVREIHRLGAQAHANDAEDESSMRHAIETGADRFSVNDVALAREILS